VFELAREVVRKFHYFSHLTRTGEFLKMVRKKAKEDNPSVRCIIKLLGNN